MAETGDSQIDQESESEMMAENDDRIQEPVDLSFSSFSGGGYEYTFKVEDPSIVYCEARYEFEAHAEEIDGASYDYIVSFTGLKPGSTIVSVYGYSPILDNENSIYTVSVDKELHVTLTPVRALSSFFLHRNGEIRYDSYWIMMDSDGYHVSINEERVLPVKTDTVSALMDVIDTYDLTSWDGFDESNRFVLDGEGFSLNFRLTDGTSVHARGDNAFPEHYFEAMGEIWDILNRITEQRE